ncbi:MAG TPA: hypothetical protein VHP14_26605 [Anaerolineales bacterium]|nr:hypothetical protein [Anaerolineales bacterium]
MNKAILRILAAVFLTIAITGCSAIASESNFTLDQGDSVSGSLFILSQNAILEAGSIVDGSVIMICCNLKVHGKVNGDIFLLTGNLIVDTNAHIDGDVDVFSGNLSN